ncbi:BTB/POZ domain-containing protein KCTD17 [Aphelenchoides avenae]|nr:BTB/POZ domain-containing protein KCTD17 [Aphelenchus avenae]
MDRDIRDTMDTLDALDRIMSNTADPVELSNGISCDWVKFNIGGTVFQTTRHTLRRESESFLCRLVDNSSMLSSAKDSSGAYLIDRNADLFPAILRYLRNGTLNVDEHTDLDELLEEAEFYNLNTLANMIRERDRSKSSVEVIIVNRHTKDMRVEIALSEPQSDYEILAALKAKDLPIQKFGRSWWVNESNGADLYAGYGTSLQVILARCLAVFYSHGFVLEKESPNQWLFVKNANKNA